MIQSTTTGIEGQKIDRYHGVVAGEAILGANIFKDIFASVRDIVGGRSAARMPSSALISIMNPSAQTAA